MRAQAAPERVSAAQVTMVLFEYTGRTALSIVGPATRTAYRFGHQGARALVDSRDRAALAAVPMLRQVSL